MKWSKREEILLISHFRDKTLSIPHRVKCVKRALTTSLNLDSKVRTLESIRSKARRLGLISKK